MIIKYNHQLQIFTCVHKLCIIEPSLSSPSVQLRLHVVSPEGLCSSRNHPLSRGGVSRFGGLAGTTRSEPVVRRKGRLSEVQDNQPRIQIMLLARSDEQYTSLKSAIINHFVIQVLFSFVLVTHKYLISINITLSILFS